MIAFLVESGFPPGQWDGHYYNTGVMVLSAAHRGLFKSPAVERDFFKEQSYLNLRIAQTNPRIFPLPHRFNRQLMMDAQLGEDRLDSYFLHYAGMRVHDDELQGRMALIAKDLACWQSAAPNYRFEHHMLFVVEGTLEHQVAAEPTLRFAVETLYPGEDVEVVCPLPELFWHLRVPVFARMEEFVEGHTLARYRVHHTAGEPPIHAAIQPGVKASHPVNACALSALGFELPPAQRTVRLPIDRRAVAELAKKTAPASPAELVVVHPPQTQTADRPTAPWKEYIEALLDAGYRVALVGNEDEPTAATQVDRSRCLDLVGRLSSSEWIALLAQAKVLISNDSAAVTIAGAFAGWIGLVDSRRPAAQVLPSRKASQEFRTGWLDAQGIASPDQVLAFVRRAMSDAR